MRGGWQLAGGIMSGALLVLLPKCPACLAAYLALWTGISVSFTAASWLRVVAIITAVSALVLLLLIRLMRRSMPPSSAAVTRSED